MQLQQSITWIGNNHGYARRDQTRHHPVGSGAACPAGQAQDSQYRGRPCQAGQSPSHSRYPARAGLAGRPDPAGPAAGAGCPVHHPHLPHHHRRFGALPAGLSAEPAQPGAAGAHDQRRLSGPARLLLQPGGPQVPGPLQGSGDRGELPELPRGAGCGGVRARRLWRLAHREHQLGLHQRGVRCDAAHQPLHRR